MRTIFLILIILIPSIVIGQNEKTLCKSCVHKEFYWDNGFKCDEKKLRIYYEYQMNSNITHVNLCKRYKEAFCYDNFLCKDLVPLEEFIFGTFKINSITIKDGFYLDEDDNFIPQDFYFISFGCEDSTCQLPYGGCLIVYDIDKFKDNILDKKSVEEFDISIENLKISDFFYLDSFNILFTMNIQAYFDRDVWALKADDGTIKTLLGDSPLIDLVYKKYLIPQVHIDRYYFESHITKEYPN
ncbi:MAG: hypothetical protein J5644_01320 [Bacteroidales bacterium]|nr:hypothetical protein [Bacteroidales bacterium]